MHKKVEYEPINADTYDQDSDSSFSESTSVIEKAKLKPKGG